MIGNYLQGLDLIDLDLVSEEDRQDMMLLEDFMFRGPLLMHACQIVCLWQVAGGSSLGRALISLLCLESQLLAQGTVLYPMTIGLWGNGLYQVERKS
jgi:hypothetical protein